MVAAKREIVPWVILGGALGVFALAQALIAALVPPLAEGLRCASVSPDHWSNYLSWVVWVLAYLGLGLFVVVMGAARISWRSPTRLALLAVTLLAYGVSKAATGWHFPPVANDLELLGPYLTPLGVVDDEPIRTFVANIATMVALGELIGVVIAAEMLALLVPPKHETLEQFELACRHLRNLLAGAALFFCASMTALAKAFAFTFSTLCDTQAKPVAVGLVSELSSIAGVTYTLVLASLYIPSILYLRALATRRLGERGEELLKVAGIDGSLWRSFMQGLAILAPAIAAPLTQLLE